MNALPFMILTFLDLQWCSDYFFIYLFSCIISLIVIFVANAKAIKCFHCFYLTHSKSLLLQVIVHDD